jgi:hypothetical protein
MLPQIEAPVLLIIFNRPDTLQKVFDVIKQAKPKKLYISADGPRLGNSLDLENCKRARDIVKNIDWECDCKYRFLDENVGCGLGPSSAISWAFENEERLIIIEDDCVPSISLFQYHNYLLEKYKNDNRVWLVSGRSQQENSIHFNDLDYIFSHYGSSLAWSTWKRCWNQFDIHMGNIDLFVSEDAARNVFFTLEEAKFFNKRFKKVSKDLGLYKHSWDIQFGFTIVSNNGVAIIPKRNLVEHIGLIGTHYNQPLKPDRLEVTENFIIKKEPTFVLADRNYDYFHFKNHIKKIMGRPPFLVRVYNKTLKTIGLR